MWASLAERARGQSAAIEQLRVGSASEILPTYRVVDPSVCAPKGLVEPTEIEPVTSCLLSGFAVAEAHPRAQFARSLSHQNAFR